VGKLFCIGEALIDLISMQKGSELKNVTTFEKVPGGAPANVSIAVAKYGGKSALITKLGNDAFGEFLIDILKQSDVEVDKVLRTNDANTGLAFVSVKDDGERDFSFYRNPSADLLLSEHDIQSNWFSKGDILHFCSVDLVESPMKYAHIKAIENVKRNGGMISFDPNIRLSLWGDSTRCRDTVRQFLPLAHIIKVSDEELEFITGISDISKAIKSLFVGDVMAVVYTKGAKGADLYTKEGKYESSGYKVTVADTTGAGDAFIGGFLYKLLEMDVQVTNLDLVLNESHKEILEFANASGALTASVKGAIHSTPAKKHILNFLSTR
jgi:fructokinase